MIIRSTILAARIIFFSKIIWDSSSFWPNNLQYKVLNHIISIAILWSDFRSQIIRLCFNTFWYIHFALLLFCYLVYLFHPEALLRTRMLRTHHKSPIGSQCPKSLFLAVAPFERHLPVFDQFMKRINTCMKRVHPNMWYYWRHKVFISYLHLVVHRLCCSFNKWKLILKFLFCDRRCFRGNGIPSIVLL